MDIRSRPDPPRTKYVRRIVVDECLRIPARMSGSSWWTGVSRGAGRGLRRRVPSARVGGRDGEVCPVHRYGRVGETGRGGEVCPVRRHGQAGRNPRNRQTRADFGAERAIRGRPRPVGGPGKAPGGPLGATAGRGRGNGRPEEARPSWAVLGPSANGVVRPLGGLQAARGSVARPGPIVNGDGMVDGPPPGRGRFAP
jgi:hypothetical protein